MVLGSSIFYAGRWAEPARRWANEHLVSLRRRPVWLLSSGPIAQPPFPLDDGARPRPQLADELLARGRRTFPGRLDPARLGFGERAVVTAMRAPLGDFRDWTALRGWAEEIAVDLELSAAGAAHAGTAPR